MQLRSRDAETEALTGIQLRQPTATAVPATATARATATAIVREGTAPGTTITETARAITTALIAPAETVPGTATTDTVLAETAREAERLACLAEDYEVYMRGNTFFKLHGCPLEDQRGREGDVHYLIAAPNYVVDILANTAPSVQLSQTKRA